MHTVQVSTGRPDDRTPSHQLGQVPSGRDPEGLQKLNGGTRGVQISGTLDLRPDLTPSNPPWAKRTRWPKLLEPPWRAEGVGYGRRSSPDHATRRDAATQRFRPKRVLPPREPCTTAGSSFL